MSKEKLNTEGTLKVVYDKQTFTSGFEKREFVITTNEQYPQDVKFELYKEKCQVLDGLSVGDGVKVFFNIKGNEYNDKYYVNLNAWSVDKVELDKVDPVSNESDDLPF